jgi:hypothetical protein
MSFWAQGFEPRTDRAAAQCGPGTKNCGKICIAQNAECHIGKGKVGLAQAVAGNAALLGGAYAAYKGNTALGLGLAAAGLGLNLRGQYNLGRSAGHSVGKGYVAKAMLGTGMLPENNSSAMAHIGAYALGEANARKTIRPAAVAGPRLPYPDESYKQAVAGTAYENAKQPPTATLASSRRRKGDPAYRAKMGAVLRKRQGWAEAGLIDPRLVNGRIKPQAY